MNRSRDEVYMCRIVGKVSSEIESVKYELLEAPHSLLDMSKNANRPGGKKGPHDDGWGLGYREEGKIKIRKDAGAAYGDDRFRKLASNIKTDLLLGSARLAAPRIPSTRKNAHPFRKGNLVFVHNGCINDGLERKTQSDTQDYLRWLSERWDGSEENLIKLLQEASSSWDYTSITFLMTDGEKLYVFRKTTEDEERLNYYTLYFHRSDGKFIVSSEPIDDKEWKLIDNGTLLTVKSPDKVREIDII